MPVHGDRRSQVVAFSIPPNQRCKLPGQSRFGNSLAAGRPEFQPRHEDGVLGQIKHRTRAEYRDELTPSDFTMRLAAFCVVHHFEGNASAAWEWWFAFPKGT